MTIYTNPTYSYYVHSGNSDFVDNNNDLGAFVIHDGLDCEDIRVLDFQEEEYKITYDPLGFVRVMRYPGRGPYRDNLLINFEKISFIDAELKLSSQNFFLDSYEFSQTNTRSTQEGLPSGVFKKYIHNTSEERSALSKGSSSN